MVDFRFSDEAEALRGELRACLPGWMAEARSHADPTDLTGLAEAFERRLLRAAGARGWFTLPPELQAVFAFEVARADAPLVDTAMVLAGHPIAHFATPALRARLLPRMQAGELLFCGAYTEAGAGSDLTLIETTATRHGTGWRLDGAKVLVTGARKADWAITVARTRTDGPPRRGLSMFAVDMKSAGIRVVPTPTMNGWSLFEVHFEGVALPDEALLGQEGEGWRQMGAALAAERSGMFWLGFADAALARLTGWVAANAADDPVARDRLAGLAVERAAAERLGRRALWSASAGRDEPALPAMVKIVTTELLQAIAQASLELAGAAALVWSPLFGAEAPGAAAGGRFAYDLFERLHPTISVGANELQRDAIARLLLRAGRAG